MCASESESSIQLLPYLVINTQGLPRTISILDLHLYLEGLDHQAHRQPGTWTSILRRPQTRVSKCGIVYNLP